MSGSADRVAFHVGLALISTAAIMAAVEMTEWGHSWPWMGLAQFALGLIIANAGWFLGRQQ